MRGGGDALLERLVGGECLEPAEHVDEVVPARVQRCGDGDPDVAAGFELPFPVVVAEEVAVVGDETVDPAESPHEVEVPQGLRIFAVGDHTQVVCDLGGHDIRGGGGFGLLVAGQILVEGVGDVVTVLDLALKAQQRLGAQQASHGLESCTHVGYLLQVARGGVPAAVWGPMHTDPIVSVGAAPGGGSLCVIV